MYQHESIPKYNAGVLNSVLKYLQSQILSNICKYSNKAILFSKTMHIWQEFFCNHENNKISSSRHKKKTQNTPPGYYSKGSKFPQFGNYWLMHNPIFATFYTGYIYISISKYEHFIFQ